MNDPIPPDIVRIGVTRRWSDAVIHQGVGYFVEVPDDPKASADSQFRQVLEQMDHRLSQMGSDATCLLQVQILLPNPSDLIPFNAIWDDWIPAGHAPSRACIHAALAHPEYRVELIVTAAVPGNKRP
jgi:enamine deaminase RidA (YjgF/YER057c/UK114 family)